MAPVRGNDSPLDQINTRSYQQEMLEASLRDNIIVAQDTGSGKTHIAVLRMKVECDRQSNKVSWFVAPTVALCEQQHEVISKAIGSVGLIHGGLEPKQWTKPDLWRKVLDKNRVIVSTPQVLLDALSHGYLNLGKDIGLLVFDEAHHANDNNPMNCIMKDHYFSLPVRLPASTSNHGPVREERPMVLGLTASPMFGGNAIVAFRTLEKNLDSVIRSPMRHRDELSDYVHRPIFRHVLYDRQESYSTCHEMSPNLRALMQVVNSMDIHQDPYVLGLRDDLQRRPPGPDRQRIDQKLSKVISKKSSYTHKGLQDFLNTARDICYDLGPWAADWYIQEVIKHALESASPYRDIVTPWQRKEKTYLLEHLDKIAFTPVSYDPAVIDSRISAKLRVLVRALEEEKARSESFNEPYSGLIFVTRRDAVLALSAVLEYHPRTRGIFRLGTLVGSSESSYRNTLLDITRKILKEPHANTLADFRTGEKNLVVATSVAEEGLDIQACGNVIRWDIPPNMASWTQSRGRARKKRSSFVLMFEPGFDDVRIEQFRALESEMVALYKQERKKVEVEQSMEIDDDEDCVFRVESTGALLTLQAAITHLNHFCSILPTPGHESHQPLYDIDPPDMPEGWHALESQDRTVPLYQGPYGCTLTLPKVIDASLRVHSVERVYRTKRAAYQHAAFKAYVALYHANLLNDNLLPLTTVKDHFLDEEINALLRAIEKRTGMAAVAKQLNPWKSDEVRDTWWSSEIVMSGLPPITLLTQTKIPIPSKDDPLFLYHPEKGRLGVTIQPAAPVSLSAEVGQSARLYTRKLFWTRHGNRMTWGALNFAYLFVPSSDPSDAIWKERFQWSKSQNENVDSEKSLSPNAESFGKAYNYPTDITCVRDGGSPGKPYRFIRWHFEKLPAEEEEELCAHRMYSRIEDLQVTYPLLVVEPLPNKANFLLPSEKSKSTKKVGHQFLLAKYTYVDLLSSTECEYSLVIPSILRHLMVAMTVESLRETLFVKEPRLAGIPTCLLVPATTAPAADDIKNYQRLESLGDAVLKFIVAVNLLAQQPLWPEGYLTKQKDHTVNNARLAKAALKVVLYRWIIRNRFTPKKYTPLYLTSPEDLNAEKQESANEGARPHNEIEQLSTKMLADVVESLIGAAYLHGGFDLGIQCTRLFQLGIDFCALPTCVDKILSRVLPANDLSGQLAPVEQMIGYTFRHKLLLVEALTHDSYQFDNNGTVSYQRMEFLGDALLDIIVIDYLYRVPGRNYSPCDMHELKAAVVNTHFLAYRCLQLSIEVDASMPAPGPKGQITMQPKTRLLRAFHCLLHWNTTILEDEKFTFARFEKYSADIEKALATSKFFPWGLLLRLQAPKVLSDMIESLIGAVYLDSQGNMETVHTLLRTLGIQEYLERIVRDGVDVLHPVSRLGIWASRQQQEVDYKYSEEKGKVICTVTVGNREPVVAETEKRGHASKDEARFAVAEKAIALWDIGSMMERGKSSINL